MRILALIVNIDSYLRLACFLLFYITGLIKILYFHALILPLDVLRFGGGVMVSKRSFVSCSTTLRYHHWAQHGRQPFSANSVCASWASEHIEATSFRVGWSVASRATYTARKNVMQIASNCVVCYLFLCNSSVLATSL